MITLFLNEAVATESEAQRISRRDVYYRFSVAGTFGGASVSLETQDPFGTWVDLATATEATATDVRLRSGDIVRATITGGTGFSITAALKPLGS